MQGRPLTREFREAIVLVKNYFDGNRHELGRLGENQTSYELAAHALEVGVATVRRVVAANNKSPALLDQPPAARGRPAFSINSAYEQDVRTFIREANCSGKSVTLETIRSLIHEKAVTEKDEFSLATLARTLDRWGFTFGKGTRSQQLKEKEHVIAARRRYLRLKRQNRTNNGTNRPEVYLDESYVNKNHSNDFTWFFGEDGPWLQKPTGAGERLIIVNAISAAGWIPNAKLVFKSSRKTGDYHGQMNHELFKKWFTEMLLPNIPDRSLIILDNASYHNALAESSAPTPACSKVRIKAWLEANKYPCGEDLVKGELIDMLKRLAPEPTYAIDEIARQQGHQVLRTPPYHPELQPIEICWGVVKNHVARNSNFTMANLWTQLEEGFTKVAAETCRGIIKKIRENEDSFWEQDGELDALENG